MQQVYQEKLWGDNGAEFYSGEGSHHPKLVNPYLEMVTPFLKSFNQPMTVCDLGCGDFNIGKVLVPHAKKYVAVDIVPELIARNKRQFPYPNVEFYCLNIAKDDLPKGDCVILRHVLQHLSNTEVAEVADKLYDYKYILVTEHLPSGDFVPNRDIISGQGIRLKKQSGVDLLAAPFYLEVKEAKRLLSLNPHGHHGIIETKIFQMF